MDGFEFVFTVFGLMLGLSLVELVSGFGRAVEARVRAGGEGARIGLLSPLLGLFVTFNLVSFWTAAWAVREMIPVSYAALLFGLAVTGGYYLAAFLVFPREVQGRDLDAHYFEVKRWVAAVVAGCNALGAVGSALVGLNPIASFAQVLLNLLFYGLLAGLFVARGRRLNLVLLVVAVAVYPVTGLLPYAFG